MKRYRPFVVSCAIGVVYMVLKHFIDPTIAKGLLFGTSVSFGFLQTTLTIKMWNQLNQKMFVEDFITLAAAGTMIFISLH